MIVQRLGDATAAGMYKLLYSNLNGKATTVSLYALPVSTVYIHTYTYAYIVVERKRMVPSCRKNTVYFEGQMDEFFNEIWER